LLASPRELGIVYSRVVLNDWEEGITSFSTPDLLAAFGISCWWLKSNLLNVLTSRVTSCWDESCGKGWAIIIINMWSHWLVTFPCKF
jgi:hypothetical protein